MYNIFAKTSEIFAYSVPECIFMAHALVSFPFYLSRRSTAETNVNFSHQYRKKILIYIRRSSILL